MEAPEHRELVITSYRSLKARTRDKTDRYMKELRDMRKIIGRISEIFDEKYPRVYIDKDDSSIRVLISLKKKERIGLAYDIQKRELTE